MKMTKIGLMVATTAFAVAGLSSTAFAGNKAGSFSVTPWVGAYFADNNTGISDHGSLAGGVTAGYNITSNWGAEVTFGYARPNVGAAQADLMTLSASAVYHLNRVGKWEPYLFAGAGVVRVNPNTNKTGLSTQTRFALNAGAGVQYFVTPEVALRGEVRDIFTPADGTNAGAYFSSSNNLLTSFGVSYVFGGKADQAVPAYGNKMEKGFPNGPVMAKVIPAHTAYFATGSSTLTAQDKTKITALISNLAKQNIKQVNVDAYASSTGPQSLNEKLSAARATATANFIESLNMGVSVNQKSNSIGNALSNNGPLQNQAAVITAVKAAK